MRQHLLHRPLRAVLVNLGPKLIRTQRFEKRHGLRQPFFKFGCNFLDDPSCRLLPHS
ncbi:MAG: hypothetical protein MZV70_68385 [Desulfobacterales bacterium]|nr:hypothetical protein [Desulfobacterales bacterium]